MKILFTQIHNELQDVFCNLTHSWTGVVVMQILAKIWRTSLLKYKIQIHIYPNTVWIARCLLQPHSVSHGLGCLWCKYAQRVGDYLYLNTKYKIHIYPNTLWIARCLLQPHSVMDWGGCDANMCKEPGKIFTKIQNTNSYLPKYTMNCKMAFATSLSHGLGWLWCKYAQRAGKNTATGCHPRFCQPALSFLKKDLS